MIEWRIESRDAPTVDLKEMKGKIRRAIREALKAGKKELPGAVKGRYTYRGSIVGKGKVRVSGMSGTLTIADSRHGLEKYRVKSGKRSGGYLHAEVVRGQGGGIPRAFTNRALKGVWRRSGRSRLPIHKLTSLSVAQMAGHPIPSRNIESAIERTLQAVSIE